MLVTIFTPTYNRAYTLQDLYSALCNQTDKNFEWLIIDDGSTDCTEELIKTFISDNEINIRYFKQNNGGKHRAINNGISKALGDLFFIVDSDDSLSPQAIEWINQQWDYIKCKKCLAGISGIRIDKKGNKIGGSDDIWNTIESNAIDIRFKHRIKGDLAEIYKTYILRQFPFPEFRDEKFCPEALIWNRIAQSYNLMYSYIGIYVCEYLSDGLTSQIIKLRKHSPQSSMLYYSELYHYKIPIIQKFKAAINYWRFTPLKYYSYSHKQNMINPISIACLPIGVCYRILDILL